MIDVADEYFGFCDAFGRRPMNWPEFVLGLQHRSREIGRRKLQLADAVRMGTNADKQQYQKWHNEIEQAVNG